MSKKTYFAGILIVCVFIFLGVLLNGAVFSENSESSGQDISSILGIVKNGKFTPVWPEKSVLGSTRLTKIQMQEARPPESGEIDLTKYEGKAIMVDGHGGGGGWVYNTQIVDAAGPILTLLVQEKFGQDLK